MKVLIADKLSPTAIETLSRDGCEVESVPDLKAEDLPAAIGDSEVLVVRSTKVQRETLEKATNLSLIVRAGAGVNTIDVAEASLRGIYVANCPGKNTAAVAELAIGLLVAADRRIVNASAALRLGAWRKKEFGRAAGLKGRVLGIVGLGQIGRAVAKRAQGLEMRVVAWSRSLTPETAESHGIEAVESLEALAAAADAVSVHLAATPETQHLLSTQFFAALRPGAIFVNTSRGEVVDTAALRRSMAEKDLRVALDVYEDEPAGGEADFEQTDLAAAITCTPHIGASTGQAAEAIADEVVRVVRSYRSKGRPANAVNLATDSVARYGLAVRHVNKVGVLARILDALREEDINVQEMENTIFDGGGAAFATLQLDDRPSDGLMASLKAAEPILSVRLNQLR